jgi:hypothetical protein
VANLALALAAGKDRAGFTIPAADIHRTPEAMLVSRRPLSFIATIRRERPKSPGFQLRWRTHGRELKFSAHDTDPEEERICNAGAAELLMPMDHLVKNG